MTKNELRFRNDTYGDAGKLVGLIYEQERGEYKITSAEFTDEELKILQGLLENHLGEGIELIGPADELNIEDLYQPAERLQKGDEKQSDEEMLEHQWLEPDIVEKIEELSSRYSKSYDLSKRIENKMRQCVRNYMNQKNLWHNPDAIIEVICHLPACYFRFNLYERYYRLIDEKEKRESNKGQKKKKAKEECR